MPDHPPFRASGMPTLIGSLPVSDHGEALDIICSHTPEIPLWPQLPSNSREGMLTQFNENLPCIIDDSGRTLFSIENENFDDEMLAFFEDYIAVSEDPSLLPDSRFQVGRSNAEGIYRLKELAPSLKGVSALKGQITGPFTLLTGLHDRNKRLGYYDPTTRDIVVKGIAMKSAWQVSFLRSSGYPVILFIDEPALAGLGSSAFISVSKDDISQDLTEVIQAVHQNSGLAGIHVCANTDWDLLLSLDIDILSFDAFGFFDRLAGCRERLDAFLDRGGILAWGIVPTSEAEDIEGQTAETLASLWEKQAQQLTTGERDLKSLLAQTLITPSCGTGSLSRDLALRVLELTRDVSKILRQKYTD